MPQQQGHRVENGLFSVNVLGCKVNQYEAEQIRTLLRQLGFTEAPLSARPNIVVVHSCAVTAASVRKLRQSIRQCLRAAPRSQVIVTGCAAKEGIVESALPECTYVRPGPGWLQRLAEALPAHADSAAFESDILRISSFSGHHRAFLKVQDGCDNSCSYCIVPSLRGPSRDKPLDEIVAEAAELVRGGYREIIVSGVSIGLYGRESGVALSTVLDSVAGVDGLERLRVSSLHPADIDEHLLAVMASRPNIMPHIHLPLQSGSDQILARMRRGYGCEEFIDAVDRAKSMLDNPSFNTDVIVGFPGETSADFDDTVSICRRVGFSRMHIFQYSARPGTDAAKFPDAVSTEDARARYELARDLSEELSGEFHRSLVGIRTTVLVETFDEELQEAQGYTKRYVPVSFPSAREDVGLIKTVRLTGVSKVGMTAVQV